MWCANVVLEKHKVKSDKRREGDTPRHRDIILKQMFRCGRGSQENKFIQLNFFIFILAEECAIYEVYKGGQVTKQCFDENFLECGNGL